MWNNDDPLLRLGYLIFKLDVSTGVLATAIEQHGVYSWDRYGRFKQFGPDSDVAQKALDQLAALHAARVSAELDGDYDGPDWEMFSESGGDYFCWPSSAAPDFKALSVATHQEQAPPPRSAGAAAREENADLRMVGALLLYILGELGKPRHPSYSSKTEFISHIENKLDGYPGLKKGTLRRKFDRALGLLDQPDWPADPAATASASVVGNEAPERSEQA